MLRDWFSQFQLSIAFLKPILRRHTRHSPFITGHLITCEGALIQAAATCVHTEAGGTPELRAQILFAVIGLENLT